MEIVNTKTSDKLHLTGFISGSQNTNKENIIVHIHGMAGNPYTNNWYPYFHELYSQNNFSFLVGNHRGTGSVTEFEKDSDQFEKYGNAFEIFEESALDIDAWIQLAKNLGYNNIYIQSHSFAPSKVIYYMNQKKDPSIKGLILISPVDMYGFGKTEVKDYKATYKRASELVSKNKGKRLLPCLIKDKHYISARTFLNIFDINSKANIFNYTKRKEHDWSLVNSIKPPVLTLGGSKDLAFTEITEVQESFETLKRELKNSRKVETKIYEGADHSFEGFEERIVNDVLTFFA